MGRGRIAADEPGLARLRMLRQAVPLAVRSASARALAFATPPAPLVGLFAEDAFAVAAPLLRTVTLDADTWIALLPRLSPQGRALLRHRRDLPAAVERALESFGSVDFVLPDAAVAADVAPVPVASDVGPAEVEPAVAPTPVVDASEPEPVVIAPLPAPVEAEPIVVAPRVVAMPTVAVAPPEPRPIAAGGFQIADVVARIDAFQRQREPLAAPAEAVEQAPATCFRFDTDSAGVIFAVDGVTRGPLIGVSLAVGAPQGVVRIDAGINGAFRQRQRFADVRLDVGGSSDAGGAWRVTGEPQFDAATGRFTGYAAIARRPRSDEEAGRPAQGSGASDSLRQLVHELRTPTNAISGFAELIEAQLLGPVSPVYRDHAATIRRHADGLIAAIEDLDTAARIEGRALELRPRAVAIEPLLERIAADLAPLAALRGTALDIHPMGDHAALADDRAMERLLSRLLATLTSAAVAGERIDIAEAPAPAGQVALCFARPQALGTGGEDALLSIDADAGEEGAPLLGAGFALRLARNLASEMGGALIFGDHLLTLRLPAAVQEGMEQAAN
nr:histidine kinase dimerization/phospho-acceptor domain-containing protein [Sphingomonas aquatilis]